MKITLSEKDREIIIHNLKEGLDEIKNQLETLNETMEKIHQVLGFIKMKM